MHSAHWLSALRLREDRRVPPVQSGDPVDRSRGLSELDRQQRRLLDRRGAAVRRRGAAAMHGAARDRDGALAHHLAPRLARHHLHRSRRVHAVPLVVPGARERLQPARGWVGARLTTTRDARRRHGGRHSGGLDGSAPPFHSHLPEDGRRMRPHADARTASGSVAPRRSA